MPESSSGRVGGLTLGDYLRVLWRWKWMIVVAICASALAAYAYSSHQPAKYTAKAELLYVEPVDPTNPLGSSGYSNDARDAAVESVVNVIDSPAITSRAHKTAGPLDLRKYDITTTVTGGSSPGTGGVVEIAAIGGTPRGAAAVATAYAQAVVDWRLAQQVARVTAAIDAVKANLAGYTTDASRRSTDYLTLKQSLQTLQLLAVTATGDFKLIAPAVPPKSPSAPKPMQSAILGAGVGLLVGVGLAFLFNQLTTKVRGSQEAGEILGLPIIGSIPEIERGGLKNGRLVALSDPAGRTAESLRLLRTNLDYVNADRDSSLLITSALAGEGKSTTICNLAITIALAGKSVVLVDGDLRRPRVAEYFGLSNDVGVTTVVTGDIALGDALIPVDLPPTLRPDDRPSGRDAARRARLNGSSIVRTAAQTGSTEAAARPRSNRSLLVLPAGPRVPDPGELVASQRFGDIIRQLQAAEADIVLVDSPALMEVGDAAAMASQVEALVMIVDLEKAHHSTLTEMRHLLSPLPCKKLGAILVKTKSRSSRYGYYG